MSVASIFCPVAASRKVIRPCSSRTSSSRSAWSGASPAPSASSSAASGASAAVVSNCQLPLPAASFSREITGSVMIRRSTKTSRLSSGSSARRTSTRLSVTISGSAAPAALERAMSPALTARVGKIESSISPSMRRSRPVAWRTASAICDLKGLRPIRPGRTTIARARTTTSPTMTSANFRITVSLGWPALAWQTGLFLQFGNSLTNWFIA